MITRFNRHRVFYGLCAGLLLGFTGTAWSAQGDTGALSAAQIKSLIVGNTIRGAALATLYNIYYEPNGKVSAVFHGRKLLAEADDGTWKIKNGNTICQEFSHLFGGVERCYQWHKGDGQRYVMRNVDSFKIDDLPVWNIRKGNPLGF